MKFLVVIALLAVTSNALKSVDSIEKRGLISDIFGRGGGTAVSYIGCCQAIPQIEQMVSEANQLRLSIQGCQDRLSAAVNKLGGTKQERRFLLDLIKAPLQIATSVIKLPFQIAGQIAAVPFNIAKGLADVLEPVIGAKLTNIIKFPIDFAGRLVQVPFQFGEAVVQLPYGLIGELSGWNWKSRQEMELAKKCCITMSGLNQFLEYIRNLKEASAICEAKLQELVVVVDDLLNRPECPAGFFYSASTKRCYAVFGNPATYDEGQQLCTSVGGVLASVRNQEEQSLVETIANSIPDKGVCKCNRGGACFTTSGQTLDPNKCGSGDGRLVWKPQPGYYMEIGYTNWKQGEPNCYGGNEHCMVLDTFFNFEWNDYPCSTKTCPICEATPKPKRG